LSFDQGRTWPETILIDGIENPGKSSYTAYSDLVVLKENTLGIIYEKNDYTEIVFKVIQISF
jgi:sialidase-1